MKKHSMAFAALLTAASLLGVTACSSTPELPEQPPEQPPVTEHEHDWVRHAQLSVYPTCGEAGVDVIVCRDTDCDETQINKVPATGEHTFGNNEICDVCGYIDMSKLTAAQAIEKYGFYFIDKDNSKTYTLGDEIEFGSYPQSLVESEAVLSSLEAYEAQDAEWVSYGYYDEGAASDYMKYRDVEVDGKKYRGVYFSKYRPYYFDLAASADYSYIDDQEYELDTVYWFEYSPIAWTVLGYQNGRILLNSEYCLEGQPFQDTFKGDEIDSLTTLDGKKLNVWETSSLRAFLNDDFLNLAFSEDEQKLIPEVTLDNKTTGLNVDDTLNDTDDKIFLLSYRDMLNEDYGFTANGTSRARSYTDYSTVQGLRPSTEAGTSSGEPACTYFLRSQGNLDYVVSVVSKKGTASYQASPIKLDGASYDGFAVNSDLGVLPSLYLKVGSVEWEEHTWEYKNAKNEDATLDYALAFPKSYKDDGEPLPLITYIPDSSYMNKDMSVVETAALPQNWVNEELMEKYPAIYLITTFTSSSSTDSGSGDYLEALATETSEEKQVINIIDSICDNYNVDTNRLYLTGQSMGGIFDFAVNTVFPNKFAATVYVACQPGGEVSTEDAPVEMYDEIIEKAEFLGQKFIYIASRKDMKAPYGQDDVEKVFVDSGLTAGVDYYKNYELDPADPEGSTNALKEIFAQNKYTQYFLGFPQVSNGGPNEHMASFPIAYQVEALLEWLTSQSL